MRNNQKLRPSESGFTLLEVILALAILAGAVAVLGEIMAIAGRHGREAEAGVRAQLLASSVMDEILAGLVELNPVSRQPLEVTDTVPWIYSVNVDTTTITGLSAVEVIVEQDLEPQFNPVNFALKRWYAVPTTTSTPTDATTGAGGASG
jgi:general secretion pathway protein I